MGRVTRRRTTHPLGGYIPPILLKGTASPQFRPVLYSLFALAIGAMLAHGFLGVSYGWVALVAGAFATIAIVYYLVSSTRQAQQNVERERSKLQKRLKDPYE